MDNSEAAAANLVLSDNLGLHDIVKADHKKISETHGDAEGVFDPLEYFVAPENMRAVRRRPQYKLVKVRYLEPVKDSVFNPKRFLMKNGAYMGVVRKCRIDTRKAKKMPTVLKKSRSF